MTLARRIRVTGLVQGVGFRPHVWRLAHELGLSGWVRNDGAGVDIHAEGAAARIEALLLRLGGEAPPLARVDAVTAQPAGVESFTGFAIAESGGGLLSTAIGHDTATCAACLAELFEAGGRRWRHPFITCTHCGPRYTVTRALPYDRPQTSLAPFPLCADCEREYRDPADRRFHAETTCCPACGPRLRLLDARGAPLPGDPVAGALALLGEGRILAVKGLGGYHLAVDARNAAAVAALRLRKTREAKPFAVMFANADSIDAHAVVDQDARSLLASPERPVVLLPKRPGIAESFPGVAPGLAWLGSMLPATPVQYLLFHEAAGRPPCTSWLDSPQEAAWVMTSANPGGEPLVTGDDEALARLAGIADAFLMHDREIVIRCDDSVVRAADGAVQFIRRARGYTPRPIRLARAGPPVLALGGWFKNTVCVTRGAEAFVSQHVGDLDNAATVGFLEQTVDHLLDILQLAPAVIAHDRHPDFASTRLAAHMAARLGVPALAVQHHHAHIAAILAEHGHEGPAIGLALDGVGLGEDGSAWGGELLRVEGAQCRRLGHLAELPLPGGDRAAREPWRMAAAALHRLGRGGEIASRFADRAGAEVVARMLAQDVNCPPTSSAGRWFDAAAGLLGVQPVMAFEGQAAMLLEGLAADHGPLPPVAGGWSLAADGSLDLLPLLAAIAECGECGDGGRGAALFHATLAAALAEWARAAAEREKIDTVALGGGCLLNHLLSGELRRRLAAAGLRVLEARAVPPNDGGLSLGQAWVALHTEW
jgi:hydrogenase maturation protein HypF